MIQRPTILTLLLAATLTLGATACQPGSSTENDGSAPDTPAESGELQVDPNNRDALDEPLDPIDPDGDTENETDLNDNNPDNNGPDDIQTDPQENEQDGMSTTTGN
ncbi:hypothetical protein HNR42_003011 [Deinobacterium chartae]|uniref:Uncharacterized protein n=1 Tax=Deinobacterium chartae TaxID=521158 RepID=A0A841I178_9DEIO|nr:hypothetical protein [Deinobacterium chartae]MBB6099561.1 hypothetical protein [Deinobacterium chartae]